MLHEGDCAGARGIEGSCVCDGAGSVEYDVISVSDSDSEDATGPGDNASDDENQARDVSTSDAEPQYNLVARDRK